MLNKQEKNYYKIARIAGIAASQIVADRKGNAFIGEKIVKKLLCFLLLSFFKRLKEYLSKSPCRLFSTTVQ